MDFDLADDSNFTFVDFLPKVLKRGGFFNFSVYETFRTLVDHANDFLENNRNWDIVTCESVKFNSMLDKVDPIKMTYEKYGEMDNSYVRGLRLWLRKRNDAEERRQQIDYINLVPERLKKGGAFGTSLFESLDTVIKRFNSMQHSKPIPGRIITIESQEMMANSFQTFDPDLSNWCEIGNTRFIFVLRIFYKKMPGISEEIGVKDFIPGIISEEGILSLPQYEQFSNIMNQASTWLAQQQNLKFCNAQTLEIKQKKGFELTTQRMNYTAKSSETTYYVRILRLAYTKTSSSISENPSSIREFNYRTFSPLKLISRWCPAYENLLLTRERISAWVKATSARVVSAETIAYRLKSGGEKKQGTEASFSYSINDMDAKWIFVMRLYLDGVYKEPPPEMLPALPIAEKSCCHIS